MAEMLLEETIKENAIADTPKSLLERFVRGSGAKLFTAADFDFPKSEKTQAKIRAEVDGFLQMREDWRRLKCQ